MLAFGRLRAPEAVLLEQMNSANRMYLTLYNDYPKRFYFNFNLATMSHDEMVDERENLIGQGISIPDFNTEYYNHHDEFDKFSCVTGDYRAVSTIAETDDSVTIKVESDLDSDTETICNSDAPSSTQYEFSSASTLSTNPSQLQNNGNIPVVLDPVCVNNEHEGMTYDLLADGPEAYDYKESVEQNGNLYL